MTFVLLRKVGAITRRLRLRQAACQAITPSFLIQDCYYTLSVKLAIALLLLLRVLQAEIGLIHVRAKRDGETMRIIA
jgi:hypothetical protein